MMIGNAILAVGVVILALAPNFTTMFIGRFTMGIGNGLSWAGPVMYSSEVTTAWCFKIYHDHITCSSG